MIEDGVKPEEVTDELVGQYLFTAGVPDPDLIIRTSGELRVSNFLIWQGAYSEWYFPATYWPDFDKEELRKALVEYSSRERRYGLTTTSDEDPKRRCSLNGLWSPSSCCPSASGRSALGGWFFTGVVSVFMVGAAWEYTQLFRLAGFKPAVFFNRSWRAAAAPGACLQRLRKRPCPAQPAHPGKPHLPPGCLRTRLRPSRHRVRHYPGRLALHRLDRCLPDLAAGSARWEMVGLPGAPRLLAGRFAAYMVGTRIGKHKMAPRLSPKKSWEGYLGGIVFGTLLSVALAAGLQKLAGPGTAITPLSVACGWGW